MKSSRGVLFWSPRVLCIVAILFISLFALDAFNSNETIWRQTGDFVIHLIPTFILLGLLIIGWKWELTGSVLFVIAGLLLSVLIFYHNYVVNHFTIRQCIEAVLLLGVPFVLVGLLFYFHYKKDHRRQQHSQINR